MVSALLTDRACWFDGDRPGTISYNSYKMANSSYIFGIGGILLSPIFLPVSLVFVQ